MRVWNLTKPSDVEDTVVQEFSHPDALRSLGLRPNQKASTVRAWVGIATLAINLSVGEAITNSPVVALPSSAMALTVSVLEEKPPLASLFATRFGETWTPAQEAMLLDRIAGRFNSQHEAQQYEIVVRFIFSNQQEISHDAVQRLTIDAVGALLKRNHRGTS